MSERSIESFFENIIESSDLVIDVFIPYTQDQYENEQDDDSDYSTDTLEVDDSGYRTPPTNTNQSLTNIFGISLDNTRNQEVDFIPLRNNVLSDIRYIQSNIPLFYSKPVSIVTVSNYFNFVKYIIDIVLNVYRTGIVCGDLVSEMYMVDNFIDPKYNMNCLRINEIHFLVESNISIELFLNTIVIISRSTLLYYYMYDNKYIISLEVKDNEGYIHNLIIYIHYIPNLYKNKLKSNSPYVCNDDVELGINDEQFSNMYFINRFEHQKLVKIKSDWNGQYVCFQKFDNKYLLIKSEYSKVIEKVKDKNLVYTGVDLINTNYYSDLEKYFKYSKTKYRDQTTLSRLNMFINTSIILSFIQKGWEFEHLKSVPFFKDQSCFICSNKYLDIDEYDELYMYKVSLGCCKESKNGICLDCFMKNSVECYQKLKSSYICPFCKQESKIYNKEICEHISNHKSS